MRKTQKNLDLSAEPSLTATPSAFGTATRDGRPPLERIGDTLRKARETRGDDLQQIADYLCIRRNYLEALEESRYEEFPADAYVIGFLRSYANLLGLDGRQAIDRYRGEMAGRRRKPALMMPTPMTEGRTPSVIIMIATSIVAFLIYMTWYGLSTSDRTSITTPPPLPTNMASDTIASPTVSIASASSGTSASSAVATPTNVSNVSSSPSPRLIIHADQASWILIADSKGRTIYDHVLKAGESYQVPEMQGLTLTSGNGSGLLLTLNGVDLPRLSTGFGHVLKNISLDSEALQRPATPETPE